MLQWKSAPVPGGPVTGTGSGELSRISIKRSFAIVHCLYEVVSSSAYGSWPSEPVCPGHEVEEPPELGRVVEADHERRHVVGCWHAVPVPVAVVLVPEPHRALDRDLRVDLRVVDVEILVAEHLHRGLEQPRRPRESAEGIGARGTVGLVNAEDRPHTSGAFAEDVVGLDGRKPRYVGPQYLVSPQPRRGQERAGIRRDRTAPAGRRSVAYAPPSRSQT